MKIIYEDPTKLLFTAIEYIHNSTVMGTEGGYNLIIHPRIDVGIMSNGSNDACNLGFILLSLCLVSFSL